MPDAPLGLNAVQWIWEGESQLAEDAYVNTWHFRKDLGVVTNYPNIVDLLTDFYTVTADGAVGAPIDYMSGESITGKATIKIYDLTEPKPRYPVYTQDQYFNISEGSSLPTECAAVMSFQGERVAGLEQARRRNRIYLGPLSIYAMSDMMLKGEFVQSILFQGKQLLNAVNSSETWDWVVYSPTNNNVVSITDGWVDNGFDTQRRRGVRSTARGTFGTGYPT